MAKVFNLEDRTKDFSKDLVLLYKKIPKNVITTPLIDQGIRSGTAIGANYLEANDALGKKDFIMRNRIARKEAKETMYWLDLLLTACAEFEGEIKKLYKECEELKNILSAIINNSSK